MRNEVFWLIIAVLSSSFFRTDAFAQGFPEGLSLQVGGEYADVSSKALDDILEYSKFDEISGVFGLHTSVRQALSGSLGVILRVAYVTRTTEERTILLTDEQGNLLGHANHEYQLSSIPVSVGANVQLKRGYVSMGCELLAELHLAKVTNRILESDAAGTPEQERTWDETVLGASGAVTAGWNVNRRFIVGLGVGYRLTEEADLTSDDSRELAITMDLSGAYVALFVEFSPWM